MVKHLLEDDGMSDADLVHNADTMKLCSLFGSDSNLYVSIERWDAKYMLITTQSHCRFQLQLKDCKIGDLIWSKRRDGLFTTATK